jgi:hypothetical protein
MRAGEISRGRTTRGALSRGRLESTPPPVTHRHVLVPLPVASDDVVPLFLEPLGEVRRDEAAGAGDANLQLLLRPVLLRAVLSSELQVIVSSGRHRWCCCCVVRVVYGGGLACREPARVSARGRVNAFESAPIAKSETSAVHTATRKRTHDRRKAFDLFRVTGRTARSHDLMPVKKEQVMGDRRRLRCQKNQKKHLRRRPFLPTPRTNSSARVARRTTSAMSAQPADLVPAVEAYLAANGLNDTLSALKSEAKKKNLTPSKTASPPIPIQSSHRALRRPRDAAHRPTVRADVSSVPRVFSRSDQAKNLDADLVEIANVFIEARCDSTTRASASPSRSPRDPRRSPPPPPRVVSGKSNRVASRRSFVRFRPSVRR